MKVTRPFCSQGSLRFRVWHCWLRGLGLVIQAIHGKDLGLQQNRRTYVPQVVSKAWAELVIVQPKLEANSRFSLSCCRCHSPAHGLTNLIH